MKQIRKKKQLLTKKDWIQYFLVVGGVIIFLILIVLGLESTNNDAGEGNTSDSLVSFPTNFTNFEVNEGTEVNLNDQIVHLPEGWKILARYKTNSVGEDTYSCATECIIAEVSNGEITVFISNPFPVVFESGPYTETRKTTQDFLGMMGERVDAVAEALADETQIKAEEPVMIDLVVQSYICNNSDSNAICFSTENLVLQADVNDSQLRQFNDLINAVRVE